jgi:16S rRNA (guanine966-N2)-methyltransferase
MRITAGRFRGRTIEAPPGETTRPALTRVRQAVFDQLKPWLDGGRVLDLFCGSGGFLFEAISRGAAHGFGVDLAGPACKTVQRNAEALRVKPGELAVEQGDALKKVAELARRELAFDVIFVAPPYWKGLQRDALARLDQTSLLLPEGVIAMQRDAKEHDAEPALERLERVRERTYGNTIFAFYQIRC